MSDAFKPVSKEKIQNNIVTFPVADNGSIDFDFMEFFIAALSAYLTVSGQDELSGDEENALENYPSLKWDRYNLEKLFGKSTRGKRLKDDDRIVGTLPFVTAGEASEGISAYISNAVEMGTLISAVQKLVIKDVVLFANQKTAAAKEAVAKS